MSYEKYFKDVSGYDAVDVYRVHRIFGLGDEVLCHASKKLLLSGVRTGGKTLEQDVREARDSLNRWLEMLAEDLGNKPEWPDETYIDAIGQNGADYLELVIDETQLDDWARWVAVDKDGEAWVYSHKPALSENGLWQPPSNPDIRLKKLEQIAPPKDYSECLWEIKTARR